MADAVVPFLNMVILGSFMAGGAYQLKQLGAEAAREGRSDDQ